MKHSVKILVGMGSREQIVDVDDLISSRTSVSDKREAIELRWESLTPEEQHWQAIPNQMELILTQKNLPKSLAS